jgi:hypothetical protein
LKTASGGPWRHENLACRKSPLRQEPIVDRSHLEAYQNKYGADTFDYLGVLDIADEEFMATLSRY